MANKFETLYNLNVNERKERKGRFDYLSWAWAWAEFKKVYPEATYTIERFGEDKKPYLDDGKRGVMVFTTVTADGLTHDMWLPVMDYSNKALPSDRVTMFEINKTIMRCLVKNLAMFGLGLYIYAGEDLPEDPQEPVLDAYGKKKEVKDSKTLSDQELKRRDKVENMFDIAKKAGIKPVAVKEKMISDYRKSATADLTDEEIDEIIGWVTQESFL